MNKMLQVKSALLEMFHLLSTRRSAGLNAYETEASMADSEYFQLEGSGNADALQAELLAAKWSVPWRMSTEGVIETSMMPEAEVNAIKQIAANQGYTVRVMDGHAASVRQ